jgi:hypothetical protein
MFSAIGLPISPKPAKPHLMAGMLAGAAGRDSGQIDDEQGFLATAGVAGCPRSLTVRPLAKGKRRRMMRLRRYGNVPERSVAVLLKLLATVLLSLLAWQAWASPHGQAILARYTASLGTFGLVALPLTFFSAVALYARTLQHCLSLVDPARRAAPPRSVWLMFLLPYNFIEDFFIVTNVAISLRAEAEQNQRLRRGRSFGLFTGYAWCTAQILSLFPGAAGEVAGGVALGFWAIHWVQIGQWAGDLSRTIPINP